MEITIVSSKFAENTPTTQYTVPSSQTQTIVTIIDSFTATNTGTAPVTFFCHIVNSGGVVSSDNTIIDSKIIQPKQTYLCPELVGQVMSGGVYISTDCDILNTLVIRSSGREISS